MTSKIILDVVDQKCQKCDSLGPAELLGMSVVKNVKNMTTWDKHIFFRHRWSRMAKMWEHGTSRILPDIIGQESLSKMSKR